MRYFSMFSGIGGFELGIHQAWFDSQPNPHYTEVPIPECIGNAITTSVVQAVIERLFYANDTKE